MTEAAFPFLDNISPPSTGIGTQDQAPGATAPDNTAYLQAQQVALMVLAQLLSEVESATIYKDVAYWAECSYA